MDGILAILAKALLKAQIESGEECRQLFFKDRKQPFRDGMRVGKRNAARGGHEELQRSVASGAMREGCRRGGLT